MAVVEALTELYNVLSAAGARQPLPQLQALCEQLSDGWVAQLPELLQSTLRGALEAERWEAISASALRTGCVIDVFTQLDRLSQVGLPQQSRLAAGSDGLVIGVMAACSSDGRLIASCCWPLLASAGLLLAFCWPSAGA